MNAAVTPDWIAVDWGTTRLRAYAMKSEKVIAKASSDDGMAALEGKDFGAALDRLIGPWSGAEPPVIICGMAGARRGWMEAPYLSAPCDLSALAGSTVSPAERVHIVPGISQLNPADVMRGEETQLLGLARLRPGFEGQVCLPGTHSKWVTLAGSSVVGFSTSMTGELFDLLAEHSILRLTVGAQSSPDGFKRGVALALDDPASVAENLFGLRAEALLIGGDADERRGRLSGMLIGAEIARFAKTKTVLIGAPTLAALYAEALTLAGCPAEILNAEEATLAGLAAIREGLV